MIVILYLVVNGIIRKECVYNMKINTKVTYRGLSRQATRSKRKFYGGGNTNSNKRSARVCLKHKMQDGTIMDGPIHGPNQTCIEWSKNDMYSKGGIISDCKDIEGHKLCIDSGCSWNFNDNVCLQ